METSSKDSAFAKSVSTIEIWRKPVVAVIYGHCFGARLDMVSACDIRICSEDVLFSIKEAAVGFVADVGVLQRIRLRRTHLWRCRRRKMS